MFKLVALCAFFAAAAAKPGAFLFPAPITQYSTLVAPAKTTISNYDTNVIHSSPAIGYYSEGPLAYTHLIKKRSPQLPLTYISPSNYVISTPYLSTAPLHTPLFHSAPILPAVAPVSPALHLIKKRSAALLPTTYLAPHTYTTPLLTSHYPAPVPLISSPQIIPSTQWISQPLTYTHLIKKRSAPLLTSYIAPASYSHQSRFDLQTTHTPLTSITYSAPIAYTSPYAYSHVY